MPAPFGNNNGHRVNGWPLEHDDTLKVLFAEGMTSSEIAAELNRRFRTGYTRNAVIGRRIRMGITCLDPRKASRRPKGEAAPKPWDMQGISKRQYQRRRAKARRPVLASPPIAVEWPVPEPRGVVFADLGDGCKWPFGDGPFTFCAHPRADHRYCGHHAMIGVRHGRE